MLKKTFNGIWDEYRSLVQQIDTVFHLCGLATPASSVKLPFQYLSPLYGVHIDNVTNFCALKKKALQSFTCVLSYSSWPPGTDLGYPAKASTNWGPHPGLYAAEGEINQVHVVRSFFQSDCIAICYRDNFEIFIICCKWFVHLYSTSHNSSVWFLA